jgi:Ser/Thr protein kinase RdoA (MazF antagonist)
MIPYDELTYLGRVRRMRQLARVALNDWGLGEARFSLLRQAGNTLFRVNAPGHRAAPAVEGLYQEGQYLLRVHQPDYQASEGIELELAWQAAMRREADLPVPEPVPTLDGRLMTRVWIPGIPGERDCSLLRWLKGRYVTKGIGPRHYRAQGRLMACMHDFAARWQTPPGLDKRHWDWAAMFEDIEGTELTGREVWPLLEDGLRESFEVVARRVGEVMDAWGKGPDVYGLIHADLGVDANLLFWRGEARAIDFDDSGFGYWAYDLAIALEHVREEPEYAGVHDALLEGYAEIHTLPQEQVAQIDLFLAAWYVYLSLWCTAGAHLFPHVADRYLRRRERAAGLVERYLAGW